MSAPYEEVLAMLNPPGYSCSNRLFEWVTTSMMLGSGVVMVLSPTTIESGAFSPLLASGISQAWIATVCLLFGVVRISALVANGIWQPWGPRARAVCAVVAAFLWFQLAAALLVGSGLATGTVSPSVPVYVSLMVGEIISAFRASRDVRFNQ